jgi:hypothetical protein
MKVPIAKCKYRLAYVWSAGFILLLILLILQTAFGRYGSNAGDVKASEAFGWFLPTILPTLSLVIGVLVADARDDSKGKKLVDRRMYRLSMILSVCYLLVVSLTFLIDPFTNWSQLQLMKLSNLWLGPLQGIVSAIIGVFFFSKETEREASK